MNETLRVKFEDPPPQIVAYAQKHGKPIEGSEGILALEKEVARLRKASDDGGRSLSAETARFRKEIGEIRKAKDAALGEMKTSMDLVRAKALQAISHLQHSLSCMEIPCVDCNAGLAFVNEDHPEFRGG